MGPTLVDVEWTSVVEGLCLEAVVTVRQQVFCPRGMDGDTRPHLRLTDGTLIPISGLSPGKSRYVGPAAGSRFYVSVDESTGLAMYRVDSAGRATKIAQTTVTDMSRLYTDPRGRCGAYVRPKADPKAYYFQRWGQEATRWVVPEPVQARGVVCSRRAVLAVEDYSAVREYTDGVGSAPVVPSDVSHLWTYGGNCVLGGSDRKLSLYCGEGVTSTPLPVHGSGYFLQVSHQARDGEGAWAALTPDTGDVAYLVEVGRSDATWYRMPMPIRQLLGSPWQERGQVCVSAVPVIPEYTQPVPSSVYCLDLP
jgi:hypothetical protein